MYLALWILFLFTTLFLIFYRCYFIDLKPRAGSVLGIVELGGRHVLITVYFSVGAQVCPSVPVSTHLWQLRL